MSQINITVKTEGVERALGNLVNSIGDFSKPLKASAKDLEEDAQRNIDNQGFFFGTFKPLAASTRRDRKAKGFPAARPILIRTGKLLRGFNSKVKRTSFTTFNNVEYAAFHQFGTRKIPQRIILDVREKYLKSVGQRIANFISDKIRQSGLSN